MDEVRSRLSLLLGLTAQLAEHMEVEAISDFVLGVGRDAVEANRGTLCLVSSDGAALEVTGHVGYDTAVMETWRRFPVDAPLPASDAVRSLAPVYLHSRHERAERYPIFAESGGDGASAMLPLVARDRAFGVLVFGFDGEREFDESDRSFLTALSAQCATALDRAQLYEAALRRQANLQLVADAATILGSAGERFEEALQELTELMAPAIADLVSVHLVESPESSRQVAHAAGDARGGDQGTDPLPGDALARALHTGTEVVWDDEPDGVTGGGIIVPMQARGRVLGACVFANRRARVMNDEDRALARTLGERASVLLDNAQLLRQRTEISHRLQTALLPPSLPAIDGFELGARYHPAGEGLEVGGDFYDIVALDASRYVLAVGDVTGHGVEAAATTGLVRHTLWSAAVLGMTPAAMLEHVNSALVKHQGPRAPGTFCTVAVAALDIETGSSCRAARLTLASAGHPAPLLRRAGGTVERLESAGRLLGYFSRIEPTEITVALQPGDTMVAFTDGVIERHAGADWFAEEQLSKLVAENDLGADALAGLIGDTVVTAFPAPPADDLAIVVLKRIT